MSEMKELYAKWHEKGLEVVGVSFDPDADQAQAILDQMDIPWASVNVPYRSELRKLWDRRVGRLPTVLVIDQQGVLRFEFSSHFETLDETISDLLKKGPASSRPPTEK